jgi:hypothetical protein
LCIAIFKPADKDIAEDRLKNCWQGNSDGAGFMFHRDGKLYLRKGYMKFKNFIKAYRKATEENPEANFVIHFRMATHGSCNYLNTHPHPVNEHLGVVHNGIISINIPKDDDHSDTVEFTKRILRPMAKLSPEFLNNSGAIELIEEFITGDKLVFLNGDGQHWIVGEEKGNWTDGVWYSNFGFRSGGRGGYACISRGGSYYQGRWDDDEFTRGTGVVTAGKSAAESATVFGSEDEANAETCSVCGLEIFFEAETDQDMCFNCIHKMIGDEAKAETGEDAEAVQDALAIQS